MEQMGFQLVGEKSLIHCKSASTKPIPTPNWASHAWLHWCQNGSNFSRIMKGWDFFLLNLYLWADPICWYFMAAAELGTARSDGSSNWKRDPKSWLFLLFKKMSAAAHLKLELETLECSLLIISWCTQWGVWKLEPSLKFHLRTSQCP